MGFKTRFLLYTVPGQVFYNATRKLVLNGADAIVFVADSEVGKMDENKESLANLRTNLAEYGLSLDEIPWVLQYNKRDLPHVYSIQELNAELNPEGKVPFFEAVATESKGVFETFRGISHLLMDKVTRELRRVPMSGGPMRTTKPEETPSGPKVMPPEDRTPAPPAPVQAIVREVRETEGLQTVGPQIAFEYGRELVLPADGAQPNAAAESQPPARSPSLGAQAPSITPLSLASTPHELATDSMGNPAARALGLAEPTSRPGEIIIPMVLPEHGRCEIVLRIQLSKED
jgi:hypothetical protein